MTKSELETILSKTKGRQKYSKCLIVLLIIIGFLGFLPPLLSPQIKLCLGCKPLSLTNLSALGSYLGGTVGIFWGLASVAFVYLSFLSQQESYILGRIDSLNKDAELASSRLKDIFFSLFNYTPQIIAGYTKGKIDGAQFLNSKAGDLLEKMKATDDNVEIERYIVQEKLHRTFNNFINHIAVIIRSINDAKAVNNTEKAQYLQILRSSLTPNQTALLRGIRKSDLMPNIAGELEQLEQQ